MSQVSAVFINLLNMSITASYIVLALILLRLLFKKAPKWLVCLLWGLVGIRLIFPFSIESALSLIPSAKTVPQEIVYAKEPTIDSGITVINNIVNPIMIESFAPSSELTSINPIQIWLALAENIWVLGIAAMLIYTLISYISLKRKTRASIEIEKGIYICDNVATPFILGLFVPRIILPSAMDEKNVSYVIAHEKAHLRRLDHLWKPLGFALLAVYWFNPIMWVAYILFCRDIELACDERVIKEMGDEDKKAYSSALLSCSVPRKMITACPLAFGEVGVKERIKGVLNYKKPAFWIIVAAVITSVVIAVCFLTNPREKASNISLEEIFSSPYTSVQKEVDVVLTIPKDNLPNDIYYQEGHTFEKGEVVVFQGENTTIYLTSIQPANEGSDNLYFNFDCSYTLPRSGTILLPYTKTSNTSSSSGISLGSRDLEHSGGIIENAIALRAQGPNEQFAFYVNTDACKAATGTMRIRTVMTAYTYYAPADNPNLSISTSNNVSTIGGADEPDKIIVKEQGSILGTWFAPASVVGLNVSEIPENASVYYAFYEDGTGAEWNDINADVAHIFADMYRREFTYTVENCILTITYLNDSKLADDDFVQFRYTASGTRLTLSDVNTNRILELTRFIGEPVYNDEVEVFEKDTEIRFFGANDIPKNPVAINGFKLEFKRNGSYSSIVFPNKDYLDNTTITELGTTEPVFGFSIYQDTLNYTDKLLSTLTSCVTVDYEGNEHDRLDTAKEHIYIEINGKAAELLEVSQGKGNGHVDFYFKFKVDKPFLPSEIDSLKISVK